MRDVIRVMDVSKSFGEETVLHHISYDFKEGRIYGIVGNNGSGKTVLMKCICGFLIPDFGEITVNYKRIGKDMDFPQDTGIIIETPGFLPNYSAYQNLRFLADIRNKIGKEEIRETILRVGLDPENKKHVGKYSLGMRQRLGLAQAIMEDPSLLILDEPMNGLDNQGVEDMRKLLLELKAQGKTILLASHNREDIAILCDTVVELDHGRIIKTEDSVY